MELDRDLKVFQEIEAGLRAVPDDMVFFDDAQTEEEIFAAINRAQDGGRDGERTVQEWKTQVVRCRSSYLYAAFTFYGDTARLRACQMAKDVLKDLIVLFRDRRLPTARFERRLGQIREAMLIAMERGAAE